MMALVVLPTARADDVAVVAPAAAAISGDAAYAHVSYLADTIGSRPAGSEREAAAAAYLAAQLTSYGYQTEIQPFTIQTYEERGARLTPLVPGGEATETAALLYSGGGEVAGELVDAGLGRDGDWKSGALAGRIALLERGEITFADKVANVAAAGAIAAIVFNDRDGSFTGSLRRSSSIPVLTLPRDAGLALRQRLQDGPVRVAVTVDAEVATRESRNVVGMLRGRRPGGVVIGAHFDSVSAGPGANDNGSGTAAVIELARYFAQRNYPYTLYFVAFGSEEIGLRGSRHFVDALPEAERQGLRAMLNLDMVGVGQQARFSGSGELVDFARDAADALGITGYRASQSAGASSDHESFQRAGVPILFLHRSDDPNYHSPRDRAEFVDPAYLAEAGQVAVRVVERLGAEER
jgi:aminopeptidase YwaD